MDFSFVFASINQRTDPGNCGIFQKIPPAGMTEEGGKRRGAPCDCVLRTCDLHGAELLEFYCKTSRTCNLHSLTYYPP